jgi:hypothetical protein
MQTYSPHLMEIKNRNRQRRIDGARAGRVQQPLARCLRLEIPQAGYACTDHFLMARLKQRIRDEIHSSFEIVFDWSTSGSNGLLPGHHVYQVVQKAGIPSYDELMLVMSLQNDDTQVWPKGVPRAPGEWVIEALKKRLNPEVQNEIVESVEKAEAEQTKKAAEPMQELKKDLKEYSSAGKNKGSLGARLARKQKYQFGRSKSQVRM